MRKRLELIQILRGLAAIMVIMYHSNYWNDLFLKWLPFSGAFDYGWLGVDFFFVLSGFIITFIHLPDLKSGDNILPFLKKRFLRIFPIYWIAASLALVYILFIRHGAPLSDGPKITRSVDSVVYILKSYLLIPQKANFFLGVAWTLSYEMLFYLIFATCIKLKFKLSLVVYISWIALIVVKYLFFRSSTNIYLNYIFNPIVIEFLIGCLVAYLFTLKKNYLSLSLFIGIALLLVVGFYFTSVVLHYPVSREYLIWILLFGLTAGLLVWSAAVIDNNSKYALKIPKPQILLLLGNASYSIYLIHDLFLRNYAKAVHIILLKLVNANNSFILYLDYLLFLSLTIITSFFFYQWVEKPLMKFIYSKPS